MCQCWSVFILSFEKKRVTKRLVFAGSIYQKGHLQVSFQQNERVYPLKAFELHEISLVMFVHNSDGLDESTRIVVFELYEFSLYFQL